MNVTK